MTDVFMHPIRIAEGEQEPETCDPKEAEGWRVFRTGQPAYFYKNKHRAAVAFRQLKGGMTPPLDMGGKWWAPATAYLP